MLATRNPISFTRLFGAAGLTFTAWVLFRRYQRQRTRRANLHARPVVQDLALPGLITPGDFAKGSIYFVGTATVILRYAGLTILTDPNFLHQGDHIHLGYGLTARRLTNPAMELEDLPPVDLVVLSHMHEDHFDRQVQARLDRSWPILTTRQAAASLKRMGFQAPIGLNPWEAVTVRKGDATLKLTAMPGKHAPGPMANLLPPVNGSMLEFSHRDDPVLFRLYISGDTLIHEDLYEIPRQYPDIDLALLHLGGTRVLGVMVTMDGNEGVRALRIIAPHEAIPIHFNDYTRFKSPLSEFKAAVAAAGLAHKVHYLAHGETFRFRPAALQQSLQASASP